MGAASSARGGRPFAAERRRLDCTVELAEASVHVYPLRISELRRVDLEGRRWSFRGRVDQDADLDDYDSDGCHLAVKDAYDTETRLDSLFFSQ